MALEQKKIDVIGQMIMSAIPVIATPLYAFYKIKKFKKGILVILANMAIDLVFMTITGDINWTSESNLFLPKAFTVGSAYSLVIDILFPMYFARKWTIEHNEKIDTSQTM